MKHITQNQYKKGFSLIEVIVAVFVIVIGIVGALNLISYSISRVSVGKSMIIATELAQEGLEMVRDIRDSNWLLDAIWNNGLGPNNYRVQYNNQGLITSAEIVLQINSTGFYGYNGQSGFSGGTNTLFKRKITITNMDATPTYIKVVCEVTWSERGKSFVVNAEDRLYNWK